MPSRAERRPLIEGVLQGTAMLFLAVLAWRTFASVDNPLVSMRDLPAALAGVTQGRAAAIDVAVDSMPGVVEREWLRAARDAGVQVRWSTSGAIASLAASVEPTGDPVSPARTVVEGPAGTVLRDTIGEVWRSDSSGTAVLDGVVAAGWRAVSAGGTAVPALPDTFPARRVRVTGHAGWEARFLALALVEAGWHVESDYTVNPGAQAVRVRTNSAMQGLDTATHAALVIVSAAGEGSPPPVPRDLVGWVRSGGGVVLVGPAIPPGVAQIVPAREGAHLPGVLGGVNSAFPRSGLDAVRLLPRREAVVVEARNGSATIVARREGLGRIVRVSYLDTWRWRMEGGEHSSFEHAAWWSSIVASASRVAAPRVNDLAADPAPVASMHAALGAPEAFETAPRFPLLPDHTLLAIAFALLLAAWGSRRLRGSP